MDDMIDFPCSDTFRDYFYQRGLTPYPSPSYNSARDERLAEALESLADAIQHITLDSSKQRDSSWRPSQATRTIRPPTGAIQL